MKIENVPAAKVDADECKFVMICVVFGKSLKVGTKKTEK